MPPMLALAEAFLAAGHKVTWIGQPSIEVRARAAGCQFLPLQGIPNYESRVPLEDQPSTTLPVVAGGRIGDQLGSVATLRSCDLVVVDANLAGCAAAAEALDRPSAVLLHSMYAAFTDTWLADTWPLLAPVINNTRQRFGLGPSSSWADVFAGHQRIISVVPERFDAPVAARPTAMRYWGFLVPNSTSIDEPGQGFGPGDEPCVLVGLSTTYQHQERLLQDILNALAELEVRGVASTAGQVDNDTLRCPPNVTLFDFVDHGRLLADCDVMVTHAGLGSVAAALSRGVPLVCTPHGRDQPLNAQRVVSLGAGLTLGPEPDAAHIAEAIQTVLTKSAYRDEASRIANESLRAGGPTAAVEDLETLPDS